ncbi:MAG: major capsid protein [Mariprofundaceae bacterium]|nr:major capsid protein [Mariprofundaceae bacterium]
MPLGIFEPRRLIGLMDQTKPKSSFLLDTFFKKRTAHDTRSVEVDIIKGRRRLAPFVSPLSKGMQIDRTGAVTRTVTMPYIKLFIPTRAGQALDAKHPGSTVYQQTPSQRMNQILAKDIVTLRDMVDRREEAMAADALVNGSVTATGEGIDVKVDFLRPASHRAINTATGAAWDAAGVDILKQLRGHARTIVKSSGLNPDICVMGSAASDAFIAQMEAKSSSPLSMVKITSGAIKLDGLHHGATYLGNVEGVDFYEYNEWAEDANGVEQPLLAANQVIFGSTRGESVVHYGAIEDLAVGNQWATPYFVKSYVEDNPSARFLLVQSAPLPALHRIESVMSIAAL